MSISSCTATSRAGFQNGSATPKHLGAWFGISPCTQKEYIMKSKTFNKGRSRVNSQLLSNGEAVLRAWLEGERQGEHFVAINPCRDDKNLGSFKVTLATGFWKDYAVEGFSGPDLVSLYMVLNELDEHAAVTALEETLRQSRPITTHTSSYFTESNLYILIITIIGTITMTIIINPNHNHNPIIYT